MKKLSLIAGIALLSSLTAQAQTTDPAATPRFDQRQTNQRQRIEQGVASGQLTPREAARLEAGQERLQRMENRAKADGTVTTQERARLRQAENLQSQQISQQKHDRQHDLNHDGRADRPARRR